MSFVSFRSGLLGENIDGGSVDILTFFFSGGCGEVAFMLESLGCSRSRSTILSGADLSLLKRAHTVSSPLSTSESNLEDEIAG